MQEPVLLACDECKRRNYATTRTRRPNRTRLARRKFCKWCRRHTLHKETKAA